MEWKPIETAPKDGTVILLYGSEGFTLAKWSHLWNYSFWVAISGNEKCFTYDECYVEISDPTHWMPLPDSPQ